MTDVEHSKELVQRELAQILASPGFARNARMSQFLRVLVERHLDGRDEELKESLIAVEVFGRKPDYDPKLDSIVRTEAARLRARLVEYYAAEGQSAPVVIEVPKGGYVPSFVFAGATPAAPPPAAPMPPAASVRPNRVGLMAALAGVIIIVVAGAGWWYAERPRAPIPIAVLPLVNLSDDPANEFFVDGLTAEIIRNLSIIDGLAVRSRTSSFALKGDTGNVHEKGRQLAVDYLVEASAVRDGEQLRVDVHLIRVRDDYVLWSRRFDKKLTDVFAIQDEISLQIVNNLRLHLGRGRRHYEWNVPAYTAYLEAQGQSIGPARRETIQKYEQAIALDPSLAPAYASLSTQYAIWSAQFPGDHSAGDLEQMRSTAQRAVDLDPLLPEAYDALGLSQARDGEWGTAEQSFRRAIELDPNRAETRVHFANWLLDAIGRNEEQLEQFRAAAVADPLSSEVRFGLGWTLVALGRYDEAESHCARVPDTNTLKPQCLARIRLAQGKAEEAVQILRASAAAHFNPQTNGFLGYALARSGRREEAAQLAENTTYPNEQALIYAGLGDKDRTLDALDRMSVRGPQRVGRYLNNPEFALLRDDPRLPALRKKVGLPQ
ncbi:MAG TPA: tetratricopeptide repeat protein [Vicinamibacterales bacterium]|nr:tetratricopeptide repeat protein [Vicinamibacterales bacterium]